MTEKQFEKCLTCLNRKKSIFDKNNICNLRNKDLNFINDCKEYFLDNEVKLPTENQNVFEVYEKLKKPFFTLNSIFYIFSILLIVLSISIEYYGMKQLKTLLVIFVIIFLLFLIITSFINFNKIEKLNAKYLGKIIIYKDSIKILTESYNLSEIKKVVFYNNDFVGAHKDLFEEMDLMPGLSNGIDNKIILELNNGITKKYNFIQKTRDDLLQNREILIHYFLNEKLDFDNLKKSLHLLRKKDVEKLKIELEKRKTLYNNQYKQ